MNIQELRVIATELNKLIRPPEDEQFKHDFVKQEILDWISEAVEVLEPQDTGFLPLLVTRGLVELGYVKWLGELTNEEKKRYGVIKKKNSRGILVRKIVEMFEDDRVLSKENIAKELYSEYPGVGIMKIASTVNAMVPVRIEKYHFKLEKLKNNKYKKA